MIFWQGGIRPAILHPATRGLSASADRVRGESIAIGWES